MDYKQCSESRINQLYQQAYLAMEKENEKKTFKKAARITSLGILLSYGLMFLFSAVISLFQVSTGSINDLFSELELSYILIIGLSNAIPMLISAIVFAQISNSKMSEIIPFDKISLKKCFLLVSAGLAVCMIGNLSIDLLSFYFDSLGIDITSGTEIILDSSLIGTIFSVISIALVPALGEELLFRGAIMGYLRKYDDKVALLVSSALFGLFHGNLTQTPFAFIVGLSLGYVAIYSNSLLPAIIIHFINNAYSVIISSVLENYGEQVATVWTYIVMIIFLIVGSIAFYYLSKDNKNFGKINQKSNSLLSFKEKSEIFFKDPFMIIFIVMMCVSCIMILAMSFISI